MLQTEQEIYRGVSYNPDVRQILVDAEKQKSPLKLKNIKRKVNFFDRSKLDIEINNRTNITNMENDVLFFKYQKLDQDDQVIDIAKILREKREHDIVSVVGHISIENRPVTKTTLKHSGETIEKKEVAINDKSGLIKMTLWEDNIAMVPKSAVYKIEKAKVREWPKGVLVLNTTPSTLISPSDANISPSKSTLPDLVSKTIQFPSDSVHTIQVQRVCPSCHEQSETNSKLFKCPSCKSMTLTTKLKCAYTIKLKFLLPTQNIVTLFHNQVENYFNGNIPIDLDDIVMSLLSDECTALIVNCRGICIGLAPK